MPYTANCSVSIRMALGKSLGGILHFNEDLEDFLAPLSNPVQFRTLLKDGSKVFERTVIELFAQIVQIVDSRYVHLRNEALEIAPIADPEVKKSFFVLFLDLNELGLMQHDHPFGVPVERVSQKAEMLNVGPIWFNGPFKAGVTNIGKVVEKGCVAGSLLQHSVRFPGFSLALQSVDP